MARSRTFWIALCIVAALLLWLQCGKRTYYPLVNSPPPAQGPVIAFGDSLTVGEGAPERRGYVGELERHLNIQILNRGRGGDTASDALRRLETDVLAERPRIVLVCLGGIDILRRRNPDETFGALEQIVRRIQQQGALVILIGIQGPPGGPGSDFGKRFRALAERTGCPLVPDILDDIFGNRKRMADSIHPNAVGYALMADRIEPILRAHLPPGN
jgi:lysophospholipase L1-like esterase